LQLRNKQKDSTAKDRATMSLLYPLPAIVLLIGWYVFTATDPKRQFVFSSPQKVFDTLVHLLSTGALLRDAATTTFEALAGFILGTTSGALIGLTFWYSRTVAKIAQPYISALASVPIFAIAPMIIVWFGIGVTSKIMLAFLSTVVVAIVQSYQGSMSVEPRILKLMQVLGATRNQVFRIVVVPSSLIWVINAMKLNIGLALLGAFIGEFISSEQGLGYMIVKASGLYDMATVLVGVFTLICIALFLTMLVGKLEGWLLRWKHA
jgi:NitT/TauT family transport system permease protein